MHYLDTSVVVALLFPETYSNEAENFVNAHADLAASAWVDVELESVLNRKARTESMDPDLVTAIRMAYASLRAAQLAHALNVNDGILDYAAALLRDHGAPLRSADALHLAIAGSAGATLVTADRQLASAANHHGIEVRRLPESE